MARKQTSISEEEEKCIWDMQLLTKKQVLYAANVSEDDVVHGIEHNAYVKAVQAIADSEGAEVLPICAGMERRPMQAPPWPFE